MWYVEFNIVLQIYANKQMEKNKDCFKIFNHALKEFLNDIIIAFPDATELKAIKLVYKIFKEINRNYPQKQFNQLIVVPYEQALKNRDEDYIMADVKKSLDETTGTDMVTSILKKAQMSILERWKQLSADQKSTLWDHMDVLVRLNNVCNRLI